MGISMKHIQPGEVWIAKSRFNVDVVETDVICKVLKVFDDSVFIIRKTQFGFKDLEPVRYPVEQFLEMYQYYGRITEQ